MSERGSFITQFMYCPKCFKKLEKVLCTGHKYLDGKSINDNSIIAGRLGSCGPGSDTVMFKYELFNKENAPCCPVRVALIPDSMEPEIVVITSEGNVVEYEEFMEENPNFIFT